jgi:CheY-like chemotaxis protein
MSKDSYKPASILLVDDDDIDAMAVKRALNKMKIANPLVRAKDGVHALEILEKEGIDTPYLILLDLNMPRMGGLEFLKVLRRDERWESSVVFVLTTSKADEDKLAAYKEHIAGYILKEKLHDGFDELVKLLDHYWRLVEFPNT